MASKSPCAGNDRTNLYDDIAAKVIADLEAGRRDPFGNAGTGVFDPRRHPSGKE